MRLHAMNVILQQGKEFAVGILPGLGVMGFVGFHGLGIPNDLTDGVPVFQLSQGNGLHQQVADGSPFDGTCDHGAVDGISGHMVEQLVLDAAADDVQCIQLGTLDLFQPLQRPAVLEGQRFVDAPGDLSRRFRNGLPGFAAKVLNFTCHVAACEERTLIRVHDGTERFGCFGKLYNLIPGVFVAGLDPISAALLD